MIELNPEQRQAVAHGEPVCIIDPSTHDTYILVRAEVYARLAARSRRYATVVEFSTSAAGLCPPPVAAFVFLREAVTSAQ